MVGYYYDTYFFWCLFILGYLATFIGFIVHTYYHGMFRSVWANFFIPCGM